jgi:hypothetical protein
VRQPGGRGGRVRNKGSGFEGVGGVESRVQKGRGGRGRKEWAESEGSRG